MNNHSSGRELQIMRATRCWVLRAAFWWTPWRARERGTAFLRHQKIWLTIGAMWGLVYLADSYSPTDLALSVFYTAPIAATLWLPPRRNEGVATFTVLALALSATLLAFFLGADANHGPGPRPAPYDDVIALGNRALGASSQIVVAWAVIRHRRARTVEREMAAKLQLSLRATDEFVAVASHELKTPLTGARGYAHFLLRRRSPGKLPGLHAKGADAL